MKRCSLCGETKPLLEFYRNSRSKDGYRHHCKVCVGSYRDLEKERTASQAYTDRHPERALLRAARHRAKKRGLDFNIDESDVVIPEFCPVFGMKLRKGRNRARAADSATIDRIDNDKGYIKGNVIVVSWKANCLKRNFTVEDICIVASFYTKLTKAM